MEGRSAEHTALEVSRAHGGEGVLGTAADVDISTAVRIMFW